MKSEIIRTWGGVVLIILAYILWPSDVVAGPYAQLGYGWIRDLPVENHSTITSYQTVLVEVESETTIRIETSFFDIAFGYRFNNDVHIEYYRFGLLDDTSQSISTLRLYKRWELK